MTAVVITVATERNGYIAQLEESCQRFGYDFQLLGMGEKWEGFGWRLQKLVECAAHYPDETLVVFADAYDVVMTNKASRMRKLYLATQKEIVVGVYRYVKPFAGYLASLEFEIPVNGLPCSETSPYRLPCAGCWITTAASIRKNLVTDLPFEPTMDDQRYLCRLLQDKPEVFYVDCGSHLMFHAFPDSIYKLLVHPQLSPQDGLLAYDGKLLAGATKSFPCMLHALGNIDMDTLLHELGFKNAKYNYPSDYIAMKTFYHLLNYRFVELANYFPSPLEKNNAFYLVVIAQTLVCLSLVVL